MNPNKYVITEKIPGGRNKSRQFVKVPGGGWIAIHSEGTFNEDRVKNSFFNLTHSTRSEGHGPNALSKPC